MIIIHYEWLKLICTDYYHLTLPSASPHTSQRTHLVTTPAVFDPHLSFHSTPASTGKQLVTMAALVITKDDHELETT